MPPKTGLLGTLSSIALGASLAVASTAASAQDQLRFVEMCSWINDLGPTQASIGQLDEIIQRLANNDEECYFDPATGVNYCKACLTLAAEKRAELVLTAAGPVTTS